MSSIVRPSVQSLLLEMRFSGQTISTGTGFVVDTPIGPCLITNRHNVTGRDQSTGAPLSPKGAVPNEIAVWHNQAGSPGTWQRKVETLYAADKPRWHEHPTLAARADFVALPLTDLSEAELMPYGLADPLHKLQLGPADAVSVIGFPFSIAAGGLFGIWATGFLASEPAVDVSDLPIQLIDCRTRPGQSGSPVIAFRGGGLISLDNGAQVALDGPMWNFIGVYSGRINDQSDLGIVWKASAVRELVSALGT